jgi:hypothetical protein
MISLSSEIVANSFFKRGLFLVHVFCAWVSSKYLALGASHFSASPKTEAEVAVGGNVGPVV